MSASGQFFMSADNAAVLFPNLAFIGPEVFYAAGPEYPEFRNVALRAYNDFILEWASADPNRLLPLACIPYWNVKDAVAEIERCAELGHRGLVTTGKPHIHGQPILADRHYDPMWAAAQDAGLSINFHVGGGRMEDFINEERIATEKFRAMMMRTLTGSTFDSAHTLTDLLSSGVLSRFPDLKFVTSESAVGYIPFLLESLDYAFKKMEPWRERPDFQKDGMLPSDYFHRQCYANFWYEKLTPWHVEKIGADNLLWESDYPHQTCLIDDEVWDSVDYGIGDLSNEVREKVCWENAAQLYHVEIPAAV
ncbi:hypothetical protein BHQ17_13605 [Mycolicibacterium holsaticum]|uniref:Amidohydrolase-related domain-containing protein n=2 Tax=Mycolicibacterium holsaticum TaxID=152142 RepID=A0A1E3RU01_9MYCO|nr:hypothetical protein BHQ17_13605 [Mycolicibacterium holsaticum]